MSIVWTDPETKDHVPPRGIFPQGCRQNLITVPACDGCNHASKLNDEYFRTVIAAASNDSPRSLEVLRERIIPGIREAPLLAALLLKSVQRVDAFSDTGVYIGRHPALEFDRDRIQTVVNKTVRGLYWKHLKKRLPADHVVGDFFINPKLSEDSWREIAQLPLCNVGDGSVFSYRWIRSGSQTIWLLMFYNDSTLLVAGTAPSAVDEPGEVDSP